MWLQYIVIIVSLIFNIDVCFLFGWFNGETLKRFIHNGENYIFKKCNYFKYRQYNCLIYDI